MRKFLTAVVLVAALTVVAGCKLQTPEIRGVVLDAETKEPVADAWVASATISITSKTFAGDVGKVIAIQPAHLRTGKAGRFIIPSKHIKKPSFPFALWTRVDEFEIGVTTLIDKSGDIKISPDELSRKKIEVTVYVEEVDKAYQKRLSHVPPDRFEREKEQWVFSGLQGIFTYCISGRSGVAQPPVTGGCDDWELDFIITQHERYLERYRDKVEKDVNTVVFDQLAYLYEEKGDYEKAIETLRRSIALIERRGLLKFEVWKRNKTTIEHNIKRLKELLQKQQPKP